MFYFKYFVSFSNHNFSSFGRRPTVVLSHTIYFLGGLMTLFSPYFWLICCSRFFVGFAHLAISHLPYLIGKLFFSKVVSL